MENFDFHIGNTLNFEFSIGKSGGGGGGGSDTPGMAREFVTVYARGITGATVNLEEASE